MMKKLLSIVFLSVLMLLFHGQAMADSNAELAQKLSNPVAALISVPFQFNYDENIGPDDRGERMTLNVQPVVPMTLNDEWNLISRTILPLIHQTDIPRSSDSQTGTGDTVQSLFFSPVKPTAGGWIWGVGPVFLLPTASDEYLGSEKWGGGPTAVLLKQTGPWTYGALSNHIVSVAGDSDRDDVSSTFLQPFLTYTNKTAMTVALNSESTYNWEAEEWTAPINFSITQVVKVGSQLVSVGGGLRYWAETTTAGPEGLGIRFLLTFLFPR